MVYIPFPSPSHSSLPYSPLRWTITRWWSMIQWWMFLWFRQPLLLPGHCSCHCSCHCCCPCFCPALLTQQIRCHVLSLASLIYDARFFRFLFVIFQHFLFPSSQANKIFIELHLILAWRAWQHFFVACKGFRRQLMMCFLWLHRLRTNRASWGSRKISTAKEDFFWFSTFS